MADGKLIFDTSIDVGGFESDLKNLDSKMHSSGFTVGKGIKSIIGSDLIKTAVKEMFDFGVESLKTASKIETTEARIKSVFGENADEVFQFGKNAKKDLGMAGEAAMQYASVFGQFFKNAGMTDDQIFQWSTNLVARSADLATQWGMSSEEILSKVYSALKGETEAINDLGIDTRIAALSAFSGIPDKGATQAEIMQAVYEKIMHDSQDAEGEFLRNQDTFASQQKIFAANIAQTQAALGELLLPVATEVLTAINGIFDPQVEVTVVDQLTDVTEQFEAFNLAVETAAANFATTEATIETRAKLAETYLTTLETFEGKEIKTDEDVAAINNAVIALNNLYPNLQATMDPATGSLNMNTEAIRQNIAALQDLAMQELFSEKRKAAAARQAEAIYAMAEAETALADAQEPLSEVESQIAGVGMVLTQLEKSGFTKINAAAGEFANLIPMFDDYFTRNEDGSWAAIDPTTVNAQDIITSAEGALVGLNEERDALLEGVAEAETAVAGYKQAVEDALAEMAEIDSVQTQIATSMNASGQTASEAVAGGVAENAGAVADAMQGAVDTAAENVDTAEAYNAGYAAQAALAQGAKDGPVARLKLKTPTVDTPGVDGSHASGLNYVPYNDYVARLQVGEAVLTASEARAWRGGESVSGGESAPAYTAPHVTEINLDGRRIAEIQGYSNSAQIALDNQKIATGVGSR